MAQAVVDPFTGTGHRLRCALHAHTTNSDGELPPPTLVRHYDRAGFDVLAITDHWVRTDVPSTNGLLVVPSVELDARIHGSDRVAHVLAFGVTADPVEPGREFPTLDETARWVLDNGGVPFLAHPYWSGLRTGDFESCEGLLGLEVFNACSELEVGRGAGGVYWDDVLDAGRLFFGIATDDSHYPAYDSAYAWVTAHCRERSVEAVLDALRRGDFYSSSGPVIDAVELHDDAVEVQCSPARSVTLVAGSRQGARVNAGRLGFPFRGEILDRDADGLVVRARLARSSSSYGRIEVEDPNGRKAWTNPLWF